MTPPAPHRDGRAAAEPGPDHRGTRAVFEAGAGIRERMAGSTGGSTPLGIRPRWFRSLYWRVAVAFVLFLAVTLAAQAGLFFLLITFRIDRLPGGTSADFARLTAADLAASLARDPSYDVRAFVARADLRRSPGYSVILRNGVVVSTTGSPTPPAGFVRMLRTRIESETAEQLTEPFRGAGERRSEPARQLRDRGPASAAIVVHGRVEGVILVAPRRPFDQLWRELGPTMGIVGVALLAIAMTLVSLVVVGPASRRLSALADATRRFGSGDLEARAPEHGGDEVAVVAHAFNQMATELAAWQQQLRASDEKRRQLLADVSHELMTPLTAIRGYVETLTMPGLAIDEAARARHLAIIEQETARLERIVQDLLDLARLEGGGGTLELQDVAVESLFGRLVERHEQRARAKQVALVSTIAPGGELAYGDPLRLEQALQNLAANALRHTPAGGLVELRAEPAQADGFVALTVRDTGEGIPPEHLASIFDRFYKVDASRGGTSGSGLGLSIVRAIVERHGGTVSAESRPGSGTMMRVLLPTGPTTP